MMITERSTIASRYYRPSEQLKYQTVPAGTVGNVRGRGRLSNTKKLEALE